MRSVLIQFYVTKSVCLCFLILPTRHKIKKKNQIEWKKWKIIKTGAPKIIVEQNMPMKQLSEELTSFASKSGLNPVAENRDNLHFKKIHTLESGFNSLEKELKKKNEIITI